MAIHVERPATIGADVDSLYDVATSKGQEVITILVDTINNLGQHWKGTDATANLEDLKKVYEYVCSYVTGVRRLISEVNTQEITPLLKHIQLSGGQVYNPGECSTSIDLGELSVLMATEESWTDAQIKTDAVKFDGFPKKLDEFVMAVESAKETLMANWREGAGREGVLSAFKSFNDNYAAHKSTVEKVRNNLNTVAKNKEALM